MMNKIVMMALCLFAFLSLKATGLSGDMINIKGEEWVLLAKPINEDSLLYVRLMDFLPENRYSSTANWDGYTAYWKIENGIFICSILTCICIMKHGIRLGLRSFLLTI